MSDPARRMRRAVRYIKRGRRVLRFVKRLPGFDIASDGKFHHKGKEYARDNGLPGPRGPGFEVIFWPVTKPIEYVVNKLPPFRKPKRGHKRLRGLNERELK